MPNANRVESELKRIESIYQQRDSRSDLELRYSYFNAAHRAIVQERERAILHGLKRMGRSTLENAKVLEVGCGNGSWMRQMIQWGCNPKNLYGIDVLTSRLEAASKLLPASVTLQHGSATSISFKDNTFDLVLQATVLSSIRDHEICKRVTAEMLRVLKSDGIIVWYDFHISNPVNRDVRGIRKPEIRALFPTCQLVFRRVTLAPPLARIVAPFSNICYAALSGLRVFNSHYLVFIRRAAE